MRKVLVISPNSYPQMNGLAGHTTQIISRIYSSTNHKLTLLTSAATFPLEDVTSWIHKDRWIFLKLIPYLKKVKEFDLIYIQYVPNMYNPKGGLNISFTLFCFILKHLTRAQIAVMFHELYYPWRPDIKSVIMNIYHKTMLTIMLISSDRQYFSCQYFLESSKKFTVNKKNFVHLPVGSNIELNCTNEKQISDVVIQKEKINLCIFGSHHESKRHDLILKSIFNSLSSEHYHLHIIGPTKQELESYSPISFSDKPNCHFYSHLSDSSVRNILENSDLSIGYFSDGLSTRRGSLIAALQCGCPIFSTKTFKTDDMLLTEPFITLSSCEEERFCITLEKNLKALKKNNQKEKIKRFYEQKFSWRKQTKTILS